MTCYLQLSKFGDVLGILPIVYHAAQTQKDQIVLMVSRQYASILDRVDYAKPFIYDGEWDDLEGALKLAKQNFDTVIVTQTYGRKFPIQHRRSSFQLEAYHRAGALHLWDQLPLVIKRDRSKELALLERLGAGLGRFVLFADHSQSSPFLSKDELFDMVQDWLNQQAIPRKLVRLSEIRLPHLCDFLALYDAADAIIAVESAHLHLTAASKTPVLALTTDKPTPWHGAAFSKRFAWYARYSEFTSRKVEFMECLEGALNGKPKMEVKVLN